MDQQQQSVERMGPLLEAQVLTYRKIFGKKDRVVD
jgi:hypothetical protein